MQDNTVLLQQPDPKPKINIVNWINNLLKINIVKLEQLGSGSIYCQILDAIYPGHVPMNKINWQAKHDYEFLQNFKTLQKCFNYLGIHQKIDVDRLIKCKFIDNYEFINWFYNYYQNNRKGSLEYDAVGRRGGPLTVLNFDFIQNVQLNIANKENSEKYYSQQKGQLNSQKQQYHTNQQSNKLSQFQISNYKVCLLNGNHNINNTNTVSKYNSLQNHEKNFIQQQINQTNLKVEDHPLYINQLKINELLTKQLKEIRLIVNSGEQSAQQIKNQIEKVIVGQQDVYQLKFIMDQFSQTLSSEKQKDIGMMSEQKDTRMMSEQDLMQIQEIPFTQMEETHSVSQFQQL